VEAFRVYGTILEYSSTRAHFYLQITQKQVKRERSNGPDQPIRLDVATVLKPFWLAAARACLFVELYLDGWWW